MQGTGAKTSDRGLILYGEHGPCPSLLDGWLMRAHGPSPPQTHSPTHTHAHTLTLLILGGRNRSGSQVQETCTAGGSAHLAPNQLGSARAQGPALECSGAHTHERPGLGCHNTHSGCSGSANRMLMEAIHLSKGPGYCKPPYIPNLLLAFLRYRYDQEKCFKFPDVLSVFPSEVQ